MDLSPNRPSAIAEVFRALALEAGEAILRVYVETDPAVRYKADASPVTAADEAASVLIVRGLGLRFPSIPVVCEETEEETPTHSVGARFILVDPLDGTKEFLGKTGEFTVNIALIEDGRPVLGVVLAPVTGRLFLGWRDVDGALRAFEEGAATARRPIRVATASKDGLVVVASRSHRDASTDEYLAPLPVRSFVSAGSSLKFCLVAAGEADLYPRLGRTMEWDTAAGQAVLEAAGGTVCRLDGAPLLYGKPGFENPHFVARGARSP
jgi:3'(2'), 5'-bisphosphate nucleotidase